MHQGKKDMDSQARIQGMEWDTLEDSLLPSSRGAKVAASEQSLREYFGDEEYEKLRELARQSRAVRNKRAVGNVAPAGKHHPHSRSYGLEPWTRWRMATVTPYGFTTCA